MKVIGVIPARGGSKGVYRKNLQKIGNKTLLEIAVENALKASSLSEIFISSEDEEILEHANNIKGVKTLKRPLELSSDDASSSSVLIDAINQLNNQKEELFEIVVLLQATCPLRKGEIIDKCVNHLIKNNQFDSVCTLVDVNGIHPIRMYTLEESNKISPYTNSREKEFYPRQKLPQVFIRSGDVYAIRTDTLLENKSLLGDKPAGIVIPNDQTCNIDSEIDLELSRILYEKLN